MSERRSWRETFKLLVSWKMLAMAAFGLVSGLPNYILADVIKIWLTQSQVDIESIGLFTAVGLPYTWKFIWSPLMDRIVPPLGRRRGWIIITQILLVIAICSLGQFDPNRSLWWIAIIALTVAFFGASQDIALDAFRREYLADEELGFGTGVWMNTWRLSQFLAIGIAAFSEQGLSWGMIHVILAGVVFVGILTAILVPEPHTAHDRPRNFRETVIEPFTELLSRKGVLWVLGFILLYKIGDNMASAMIIPYVLNHGFTVKEYLIIVKGLGMIGLFGGVLLGGALMVRIGIAKALWIFGVMQGLSTAGYALLHIAEKNSWSMEPHTLLSGIVFFELLSTGMGQAAYASYMAVQTNKKFTATQYALLTSLMAVPVKGAAAVTGFMAKGLGWTPFFIACAFLAVPGLLLLIKVAPWKATNEDLDVMTGKL